jgi:hypothetical protein
MSRHKGCIISWNIYSHVDTCVVGPNTIIQEYTGYKANSQKHDAIKDIPKGTVATAACDKPSDDTT